MLAASSSVLRSVNSASAVMNSDPIADLNRRVALSPSISGFLSGACVEDELERVKRAHHWQAVELRKASKAEETPSQAREGVETIVDLAEVPWVASPGERCVSPKQV